VRSGLAAYDPSPYPPRWGDYSGISVDPFDFDASIWVAGEYVGADGGLNWGTWIAKVSAGSACALPSTPTGLVAMPSDLQVTLTWSPSLGTAAYNVKRATTSGGPYTTIAPGLAATTYIDAGLTNGTTYYYVVSATNACGESANSAEMSATPIAAVQAPAAPKKLNAVSSKGKVKLSWTQSTSPGVTQNKIYRSTTNGGPYAVIASIGANTTYTDTQVTGGTTYYYVVTAVSGNGESAPSNQDSAKPK
jgi:fibronectin type 3 domain-containing protein